MEEGREVSFNGKGRAGFVLHGVSLAGEKKGFTGGGGRP